MDTSSRIALAALAVSLALLSGCATQPQGMNYGHPALNAIQPQPTVIVVQQPAQVVYVPQPPYGYAQPPVYAQPQPAPRDNAGRAIVGGLVGGLVGSTIGKGDGRLAATALGTGLGTWMSVRD